MGTRRATVSVDAAAVCPRCAAGQGCGAGLFVGRPRPAELEVEVAPGLVLEPGDRVSLEIVPSRLLRTAWQAYGLPLAGLVAGALAAAWAAPGGELAAVLGALFGLVAGAIAGRRALSRNGQLGHCVPTAAEKTG